MSKPVDVTQATFDSQLQHPLTLVDFHAEWCAPCRIMSPLLEKLAGDYDGKLNVVKVNADEQPDLTARFRVRGLPTLILFKDGQPVETRVGALSHGQLQALVEAQL